MSVSSLPEWKQLLLEKKRREEEERERREKEEEEKFANMPAWKRGIIQRRKAKQESLGDREREREVFLQQVDFRSPSDGLSDTDSSLTVNPGSELSLSPDPGLWLDGDLKSVSQVSMETIVPVHENPFMRTQSARRKGKDADPCNQDRANELEGKEKDTDRLTYRAHDSESGRGRHVDLKIERFRDLSEGREREKSRDRSQGRDNTREVWEKDKGQWKESVKEVGRDKDCLKVRKDEEEQDTEPPSSFSPLVPCLRTIRADNIIIIEQDRKCNDERRGKWREVERPEEDQQAKKGMKMDLKEILAGGGSVTEIRASDVLIIKPSAAEERNSRGAAAAGIKGSVTEDGEVKCTIDGKRENTGRELRTDMLWLRGKEITKEKERPCGQATVIKEERKDSLDDNVFVDRGGRVSQLLSKFGEHRKPPSRSKSSDNFLRPMRGNHSGDQDDRRSEQTRVDGRNIFLKGVPKRSFSFSDRVICAKDNGFDGDRCCDRKTRERLHSERSGPPWVDVASLGKEATARIKVGCARLLDKDRSWKKKDDCRTKFKTGDPADRRVVEKTDDEGGDEGFMMASVKSTEGISFARRVPIKQDGKIRAADREVKRLIGLHRELSAEKDSGRHTEAHCDRSMSDFQRGETLDSSAEIMQRNVAEAAASSGHAAERHKSGFTECSSLLSTVDREAEWGAAGLPGPYLTSVLSQHTEELISKIEKIGETTVYSNEKGERIYRPAHEISKESKQDGQDYSVSPISPKRILPGPLEIQIPRTVFYVAEETEKKRSVNKSTEGLDSESVQGLERRDSWRIGKPLSRIESLREKIRRRELERLRQREVLDGDDRDVMEGQTEGDKCEVQEAEKENEWDTAAHMQRLADTETGQEDATANTSVTAFDVTQEVGVSKTCPQLPVSDPYSQAVGGEEVTSSLTAAVSEVVCDSFQISEENEKDSPKHVEEELRHHRSQQECTEGEGGEEEEEKELSQEQEDYTSPPDSEHSLSPSPPHPNSLTAMSRIYNLERVGSRSGLCLKERNVDVSSVQLIKVKPLISNADQGDRKVFSAEDICGVQKVQRQIEQFQLKEHHCQHAASTSANTLKDREAKGQQRLVKNQMKDNGKIQKNDQETSETIPKVTPQRVCSPTSLLKQPNQTITLIPSPHRSQSPEKSQKCSDGAPTPASSPSTPSPAQSPSVSPSPSPSPTQFSIRSASGGHVKRGATITIAPKKPVGGGRVTTPAAPVNVKKTQHQAQITSTVSEPARKKYPTVEEIEVIGGYLNLERSCLVKSKGTPKRVSTKCLDNVLGKL